MDYTSLGKLAVWHHLSKRVARARVLLIHGICEHSGRHLNTINALTELGFEVVRFDLRGSGRSGGRKQYVLRFDDYVEDTHSVFNWAMGRLAPLPWFLFGHSMGGLIAIYSTTSIQRLLTGLILSAPAFKTGSAISPLLVVAGKIINRLFPMVRFASSSDTGCISRDPKIIEDYYQDPFSFHFNTVRQGDEVLKAMAHIPEVLPSIHIPTLIIHGTHDRLIRPEGSYDILRGIKSSNKTLEYFPGAYHELHNDLCNEEVFQRLGFWLDSLTTTLKSGEQVHKGAPDPKETHRCSSPQ